MNDDEKEIIEGIQKQFDKPSYNIAKIAADQLRSPNKFDQIYKDRALSLLQQCQEYNIAPPTELIDLIAEYIGDNRRNLPSDKDLEAAGLVRVGSGYEAEHTLRILAAEHGVNSASYPKLVAAAKFEAEHPADPTGEKPSTAKYKPISKAAGISRTTVKTYQKKKSYRDMVTRYRAELAESVSSP